MTRLRSIRTKRSRKGSCRRGYYTLEAAMLLPLVLMMILALGYFTRSEGAWENAFHCAIDESIRSAAMACDGVSAETAGLRIERRIRNDVTGLANADVRGFICGFRDVTADDLSAYSLEAASDLSLPAGFGRTLEHRTRVKYRNFTGRNYGGEPLGTDGLQNGLPEDPVWIFPQSGEKYHTQTCTYVRATVHSEILNARIRSEYAPCSTCHSEELPAGSIVYCFEGDRTAYHRSSCRTILRHTTVIDRTEAIEKGYQPCSRCGGH